MKNKFQNSHFTITAVIPNLRSILTVGPKWWLNVKSFKKLILVLNRPIKKANETQSKLFLSLTTVTRTDSVGTFSSVIIIAHSDIQK